MSDNERVRQATVYVYTSRQLRGDRMLRWVGWGVLIAAIPLWVGWLILPAGNSITELLHRGDLLILGAAVLSTALGEVLGPEEPGKLTRNSLLTYGVVLLVVSAIAFAIALIGALDPPTEVSKTTIAVNCILFGADLVVAAISMWITTGGVRNV